ncbi:MAG: sensor histidine kinase [Bacillota bacterium]
MITAVFAIAGFVLDIAFGVLCACLGLAFTVTHLAVTYQRYRKIAGLSLKIDSILHGDDSINLEDYSEGELSILQSEIQKMVIKLREQSDALRREKAYLSDSIADISHQIRTPLTSINLLVSLLSKPGLTDERRLKLVKELELLLSRIDWLVSTLLKISRFDAGTVILRRETVPVAELIRRSVKLIAIPMELREQKIEIRMNGDETYTGDLSWSVEAIENILKNCMEHTQNGGTISIDCLENPLYTEIVISDNGRGIDKEDLPHLFERFYKGKNSGDQNVGIGLALARMIIVNQNGTIKAENKSGGGARFTIRFYKSKVTN